MEEQLKKKIKKFIVESFLAGKDSIENSSLLFEENLIDSFGVLELISFIEKEFRVSLSPSEVTIENFISIDKISALVIKHNKKNSKPPYES